MNSKVQSREMNLQPLEEEYRALLPVLETFCRELDNQLKNLLEEAGIALGFPIQARVKKWESLAEKYERVPLSMRSVKDVQDLVGLRIILQFKRDASKVQNLISKHFTVVRRYDTQERLKEDQFGYSSVHFVVQVPEDWLAVPTLARMKGLKAEIQVRTLAQHIWAEASNKLQYKDEANVPPSVRRAISRVSALLETVDLEFERVLSERDLYRTSVNTVETNEQLNVDLLEKMLDLLLPEKNKREVENYSDLLKELNHFGIRTDKQLTALVRKHLEQAVAADLEQVRKMGAQFDRPKAGSERGRDLKERIGRGVFLSHVGLVKQMLRAEFGQQYVRYIAEQKH